ncbi:hypothetical protein [Thiocapsa roseopersicina]|uniref:Uncharacterized protein n=1 Tax=Thiocapsa roseopersicina TaxID=1058 RepID=A0A1H2S5B3_THIRO|nr:hypothetical protein [Thiocapsa roseopersicina]SDW26364.1 hypothetical protein SAMN05421783_102281 [Thiocapsa roseopersicina]
MHRFQTVEGPCRTATVRYSRQTACLFVVIATLWMAIPVAAETDTARVQGIQAQRAAAGWLRLQQDQRAARQQTGPLSPSEAARQQSLEWNEAIRYRELLQQQNRALHSARRQDRLVPRGGADGMPDVRAGQIRMQGQLMELEAQQQSQRLQMQMDRARRSQPASGRIGRGSNSR